MTCPRVIQRPQEYAIAARAPGNRSAQFRHKSANSNHPEVYPAGTAVPGVTEANMTDTSDGTRKKTATSGPSPLALLRSARDQLAELTGLCPESVPRMEQTDEGWVLDAEVVELARVPETMSLMALYEVTLDPDGQLTGYRRIRRYERGRSDRG